YFCSFPWGLRWRMDHLRRGGFHSGIWLQLPDFLSWSYRCLFLRTLTTHTTFSSFQNLSTSLTCRLTNLPLPKPATWKNRYGLDVHCHHTCSGSTDSGSRHLHQIHH